VSQTSPTDERPTASAEAHALIGVESTRTSDPVSARHIREYLAGADDWNEAYLHADDPVAPPLFVLAASRRVQPMSRLLPDGQYDDLTVPGITGRSVLASWDVQIGGLLRVGDVVTVHSTVVSIEAKQGSTGPLVIARTRSRHVNQDGQEIAVETQTIIYR
jgi:N-terminal half of MaoC dehydratase